MCRVGGRVVITRRYICRVCVDWGLDGVGRVQEKELGRRRDKDLGAGKEGVGWNINFLYYC
jgi:hypothetical protein